MPRQRRIDVSESSAGFDGYQPCPRVVSNLPESREVDDHTLVDGGESRYVVPAAPHGEWNRPFLRRFHDRRYDGSIERAENRYRIGIVHPVVYQPPLIVVR